MFTTSETCLITTYFLRLSMSKISSTICGNSNTNCLCISSVKLLTFPRTRQLTSEKILLFKNWFQRNNEEQFKLICCHHLCKKIFLNKTKFYFEKKQIHILAQRETFLSLKSFAGFEVFNWAYGN